MSIKGTLPRASWTRYLQDEGVDLESFMVPISKSVSVQPKLDDLDALRKEVYTLTDRCNKYEKLVDLLQTQLKEQSIIIQYVRDMMDEEFSKKDGN